MMTRVLKCRQDAHPCGPRHRHPILSHLQASHEGWKKGRPATSREQGSDPGSKGRIELKTLSPLFHNPRNQTPERRLSPKGRNSRRKPALPPARHPSEPRPGAAFLLRGRFLRKGSCPTHPARAGAFRQDHPDRNGRSRLSEADAEQRRWPA